MNYKTLFTAIKENNWFSNILILANVVVGIIYIFKDGMFHSFLNFFVAIVLIFLAYVNYVEKKKLEELKALIERIKV
jgi:hypothetical protein